MPVHSWDKPDILLDLKGLREQCVTVGHSTVLARITPLTLK